MPKYYSGIGSRSTPSHILDQMSSIAEKLARLGYALRSGGADGADAAFEAGCIIADGAKEIYLPWKRFNGRPEGKDYIYPPSPRAFEIAAHFHPAWDRCSPGARKLHARNSHQVLGRDCETPSEFVVCWHQNKGGTMQAVRIAKDQSITIYNLAEKDTFEQLAAVINNLEEGRDQ